MGYSKGKPNGERWPRSDSRVLSGAAGDNGADDADDDEDAGGNAVSCLGTA